MKYFYNKNINRVRIADPVHELVEMHRNVRVELYSEEIENKIKKDLDLTKLSRYPDVTLLLDKLSNFHGITPNNLLITSGIDSGIKSVFEMCTVVKKSKVVCLAPTYAMYKVYADAYEVELVNVWSKDNLKIDVDDILNVMDDDIDVVFIPNPHIPIEDVLEENDIIRILNKAKDKEILVVVDEAYYMFGAPTMIGLIKEFKNLVVARTFSKGFGLPSIRLGYLIGDEQIISYLGSRRFAHETNYLTLQIAVWALDHVEIFEEYNRQVIEARDWLHNQLQQKNINVHGNMSNSLLLGFDSKNQAQQVAMELKKEGYAVKSNIPEPFDNNLLFTVGTKENMEIFYKVLIKIIERLK